MKQLAFIVFILLISNSTFSQDLIVKRTGEELLTKVIEVGTEEISYKRFDNLDGPNYSISKNEVFFIKYENGVKDIFEESKEKHAKSVKSTKKVEVNSMKGLAVSINPLGVVQFGPVLNVEFGITEHLVLNAHYRHPPFGLLTWVSHDSYENMDGSAFGIGALYFLGDYQNKFYLGAFYERHHSRAYESDYNSSYSYSGYDDTEMNVFISNIGYRFRSESGLFINTGVFLGVGIGYNRWREETRYNGGDSVSYGDSGGETIPFGMLELAFGYEF